MIALDSCADSENVVDEVRGYWKVVLIWFVMLFVVVLHCTGN